MDSNGANQTNLTEGSGIERDPAFSRDGTKIAYECSSRNVGDICLMNSDGSEPHTHLTGGTSVNSAPAFSPDGKKIVFQSTRNGISEIYKMYTDGSSQKTLTKDPGRDTLSDWGVAAQ